MIQMMLTGTQWDYNEELYPSGGQDFVAKMGNLSMTYYTNGFNSQSHTATSPAITSSRQTVSIFT
jgi:hypothetical protein